MKLLAFCFSFVFVFSSTSCTKTRRNKDELRPVSSAVANSGDKLKDVAQQMQYPISRTSSSEILEPTEIFRRYNPAVFMVFTTDGIRVFQGSGFFISEDGLAVSNYHVFKGTTVGYEVIKLSDGRQYRISEIIAQSESEDYILFRIEGHFSYIPITHRQCSVGEKVYTIGSPKGLENTFASGEISQIREDNYIQINCPIDHGSSGGALINAYGEVVGITTAGDGESSANLNFAKSIFVINHLLH